MFLLIVCFISAAVSALLVLMLMPSIIHIAKKNNLFDDNSVSRKNHGFGIPRLGGVAFYVAILFTSLMIALPQANASLNIFYAASMVLFATGIKDDLSGVHCHTKLAAQALASFIITGFGNMRITNLHGILHLQQLPYLPSILISVLLIMFIINAFNLIDGIDGLAATLGVIASCTFGYCFIIAGQTSYAMLAFSAAAALTAFLTYNFSPAKIFMGDSGSMFIGLLCAVFAIKFIGINEASAIYNLHNETAFAAAVLIVPIFDTCSVIIIRIKNKKSPFKPDRNHIHHRLLSLGLSHVWATLLLAVTTCVFICLAILFANAQNQFVLLFFTVLLLLLNSLVNYLQRIKGKHVYSVGTA